MSGVNVQKVMQAWGADVPEWILVLAEQCDASNQKSVAKAMNYKPATINLVLANKWTASLTNIEQAFKGAFEHATVSCPVPGYGELPVHECLANQRKPYTNGNHTEVQRYVYCSGQCEHSRRVNDRR